MSVIVGSARIDENGNAHGGAAGDQTGKEVSTQNWYNHSKGWRVFRAKYSMGEAIAVDMQNACNNSCIGYDQYQRDSLYKEAEKVGFDCSKVTKKCETDCSALVRVCCAYAGIMLPNFRTTDEAKVLLNSGAFDEMQGTKYTQQSEYLRRGDILVTKTQGHTVVVLSNGKYADMEDEPGEDAKYVLVTGGTVNIRSAPGLDYQILGVVKAGRKLIYEGETVADSRGVKWYLVEYLNQNGWISSKYSTLII